LCRPLPDCVSFLRSPSGLYVGSTKGFPPSFDGHGAYWGNDGLLYDGQWQDNKRHGVGIERDADGAIFIGSFVNDVLWDGMYARLLETETELIDVMQHGNVSYNFTPSTEMLSRVELLSSNNLRHLSFFSW